ncbi:uncharacterized protein LOC126248252 isoform X2 [Schistocerca nitens]|uniref:uncharacterized protein LOC126248252 isoform X2 n=1 Tax=Schistocerca nitens TaxID=7011 RepID=UPI00211836B3|nr:uncharacterized protein LOC126248252 isoform X2 [Schistocerca nitens]
MGSSQNLKPTQDGTRIDPIQFRNPWFPSNNANPYAHAMRRGEVGTTVNCDLFPCSGSQAEFDSMARNLGRHYSEADKRSEYAHHNAGNVWATDDRNHENRGQQFRAQQTDQPRLYHNDNLFRPTGSQMHTTKDFRRHSYSDNGYIYDGVSKSLHTTSTPEGTDMYHSFSSNSHTVSLPVYSTERPAILPTRNGQKMLSQDDMPVHHNSRLLPTQLQGQETLFHGNSDATTEAKHSLKHDIGPESSHTSLYRSRSDRPIATNQPVYHLTGTVPIKGNDKTGSENRNGPGKMRQTGFEYQSGFRDHMEAINSGYGDRSGNRFNPSNLTPRNNVRNGKPIIQEIPIGHDRVYLRQAQGMDTYSLKSQMNHSFLQNFSGTTPRSFYEERRRLDAVQFLQAVSTPTVPLSIKSRRPHNSYRGGAANRKEREYRCLGQWEEDGLMYTYTQRRDVEAYECFVGSIVSEDEIFIKEAGEHCQRNIDPLQHGMKLSKMGSCSPSEVNHPQNTHTTTSWLSIRPSTEMTKPWKPITAPPRVPGRDTKSASSVTTPKGFAIFLLILFTLGQCCVL